MLYSPSCDHSTPEHAERERQRTPKRRPSAPNVKTNKPKQLLLDRIIDSLVSQAETPPKPDYNYCPCTSSLTVDRYRRDNNISLSLGLQSSSSSSTLLNSSSSTEIKCEHEPHDGRPKTAPEYRKQPTHSDVFTLDDLTTTERIKHLAIRYGRVSHMGTLDRSYSFFVNKRRTAALSFKVQSKVAIVSGDPLCEPDMYTELLSEFEEYRRRNQWGMAFIGASESFVEYARARNWTTLHFATERVLNPMNNDVLFERSGKRIIVQSKQLLSQMKGGITLGLYTPSSGEDIALQKELVSVYDAWRLERNRSTETQAYITIYDPFSFPEAMVYLYTRDSTGVANGFAALREIGANNGYHIDPCIAAPGAPRGISDLLIFTAMSYLNHAGSSYLSLGFEPLRGLGEIGGMSRPLESITRSLYNHMFRRLPIGGKKAYHDKFRPDEGQEERLYLIFPTGVPGPRQGVAMVHMANISIRKLMFAEGRAKEQPKKEEKDNQNQVQSATA